MKRKHPRPVPTALCLTAALLMHCTEHLPQAMEPMSRPVQGFTLASWTAQEYAQPIAELQISRIAALGATHLSVLITAYQDRSDDSELNPADPRTPTAGAIAQCAQAARSKGLNLVFKPQVIPENSGWSGTIDPVDPNRWFDSYRSFVLPLAELAESEEADIFIMGTELGMTLRHRQEWLETLDSIKVRYSGQITYAASWDEAFQVGFWEELDYIGVNAYFPVATRTHPGRTELLAGWQPWLAELEVLHLQVERPCLFTEIGYRSVDGAGMDPHDFRRYSSIDLQEQADLYWAALEAIRNERWIAGVLWWNWLAGGDDPHATDYSPAGKPAEMVVAEAWLPQ